MTSDSILVLVIVLITFLLLVTERVRADVIALLVLGALALSGLVTPAEALSGFSSPAVVTIWAVFILSGALSRSGVASQIGRHVLRLGGQSEVQLIITIMLTAGIMSAFINNVGATALLLPVVMDIARRTKRSPSRLLIPLAYGSLLGGMTTLIGTPANLLINDVLVELGYPEFNFFDFAPLGLAALIGGILVMVLLSRHMLPERNIEKEATRPFVEEINELYDVDERMFLLNVLEDSALIGKSLIESRLGAALGINVIAINRGRERLRSPDPSTEIQSGDQLVVEGQLNLLKSLQSQKLLNISWEQPDIDILTSDAVKLVEVTIADGSMLVGASLFDIDFRGRFPVNVLAIRSDGVIQRTNLQNVRLYAGDTLLLQVPLQELQQLREANEWVHFELLSGNDVQDRYQLDERLQIMSVPEDSSLAGLTLAESRLADAFGISVLAVRRHNQEFELSQPEYEISGGDEMLVEVWPEDWKTLQALTGLEIEAAEEAAPDLDDLQSDEIGITEAVLSPHTPLAGKTLRELHFREKYGLNVLAIWRGGRPYRSNLRDMPLRLGDALLLHGPRSRLELLSNEQDFIVLAEDTRRAYLPEKAPLALLIMGLVLVSALLEILPIAIAAVIGSALMVLTGILSMEDAYRSIDWKSVFLIAGMFPLGIVMQKTGAADALARFVVGITGVYGPSAIIAALFLLASLLTQIMPNPAAAVLMIPIAIGTAAQVNLSPISFAMVIALAASTSYLTPIGHPANSLVMGPGGYRFSDYTRSGFWLVMLVLLIAVFLLPYVWPL
ncbi:MAG: SLC13 family permease [Anaerolineales bacterium]|nr:SLC13 family permease [Anaerolineales bacterium]